MNLNEIPTPETDAHLNIYAYPEEAVHQNWADFARYLERRLTIAREALWGVHDTSSSSRLRRVAKEAAILTAPKQ